MSSMPAHAVGFSFSSKCVDEAGNFGTDVCREQAPYKDIMLEAVRYGNKTRRDLTLVDRAVIVSNEVATNEAQTGAASADMGTEATLGVVEENVTAEQIANADPDQQSVLTNRNLNSIVDTEDQGTFAIDLFFQQAVDNILLWERGMNSSLRIQAIDGNSQLVGNEVLLGNKKNGKTLRGFTGWEDAGFGITTTEIANTEFPEQRVGSLGVNKLDFGLLEDEKIIGIRLISEGRAYNGPDWKVMGTVDGRYKDVPEPFALAGLALVGGAIASRRRQA